MYAPKTYAEDKNSPTVPKITEKAVEDMYNNPRMTNEEIFAFILSDLDKAEEYIAGYKRADKYTPDLSVVYGLKARAYLILLSNRGVDSQWKIGLTLRNMLSLLSRAIQK